jgi:hypothetical protein
MDIRDSDRTSAIYAAPEPTPDEKRRTQEAAATWALTQPNPTDALRDVLGSLDLLKEV